MIDAPPSPGVEPDAAPEWTNKPSKGSRGAMHVHAYAPAVAHRVKPGEPTFVPLGWIDCVHTGHRGEGALSQAMQRLLLKRVLRSQARGQGLHRTASCQRRQERRPSQRACTPRRTSLEATLGLQPGASRAASTGTCLMREQRLSSRCAGGTLQSAREAREGSLMKQRRPTLSQSLSRLASGSPCRSWPTGDQDVACDNPWVRCSS